MPREGITSSTAHLTLADEGDSFNRDIRRDAENGDAAAQYTLGGLYDMGLSVEQDYKEAAKWYRKAAKQGYADAQYSLGLRYLLGEGITQDHKKAEE